MNEIISKVYVLHIKEIEEHDALIYVLNEDGVIIRLRALGFFKPKSKNRLETKLFSLVEVEFFQNQNFPNSGKLKRSTSIKPAQPKNHQHLNILTLITRILMQFKNVNSEVYPIITKILKDMEFNTFNLSNIIYLINKVLSGERIKMELTKCVLCKRNDKISGFSLNEGGLICSECDPNGDFRLPVNTIKKLMKLFIINDINLVGEIQFSPAEETVVKEMYKNFLNDNLGWNVRALDNI